MSLGDPHGTARTRHRKAAAELIEAAHRNGWLTGPDRDLRLGQASTAQTVGELEAITRDIQSHGYAGTPAGPEPQPLPTTEWADGEPRASGATTTPPIAWILLAVGGVLLVLLGALLPIMRGSDDGDSTHSMEASVVAPDVKQRPAAYSLSARGIRVFTHAYRAKFDRTTFTQLVFAEDVVVVDVPTSDAGRAREWSFKRRFQPQGKALRPDIAGTIDLRDIDVKAMLHNLAEAPKTLQVTDPTSTNVSVTRSPTSGNPRITIYLQNEGGVRGTLRTTLGGRVLDSSTADA